MTNRAAVLGLCAALVLAPCIGSAQSNNSQQNRNTNGQHENNATHQQKNNTNTWSEPDLKRIVKTVRSKILGLSDYDVFDYITFALQGHTVVLNGYASRPVLKSEAGKVVKGIEGVESVQNDIKVLPYSQIDDHIRWQTYSRIYSEPSLRQYTNSPVGFGRAPSVALAAGGITNDPPQGYHAIHIIVNNGHVTLEGVVDSQSDADIADIAANSVPGVFSVQDNLLVPRQSNKLK